MRDANARSAVSRSPRASPPPGGWPRPLMRSRVPWRLKSIPAVNAPAAFREGRGGRDAEPPEERAVHGEVEADDQDDDPGEDADPGSGTFACARSEPHRRSVQRRPAARGSRRRTRPVYAAGYAAHANPK